MKVLQKNGVITQGDFAEKEVQQAFWHTSAHVLAQAVKSLYPDTKCAIGPAIENGFYYDFEFSFPFGEEHLQEVEVRMREIMEASLTLQVYQMSREEALGVMERQQESYKVEMIQNLPPKESITFYRQGDYVEFCAGPHVCNTSYIKAIKLLSVAGAYWRGNEHNKMMTRIYGISFPKASQLEAHMKMLEEAKLRDHRRIGREMGLFTVLEEGPGFPFFLHKGVILRNLLINMWREIHRKAGYQEIATPLILKRVLWETSGHWEYYRDNMYTTQIDEEDFVIKPMNCPGGMLVYKLQPRSYKELPLRMGELGIVHRPEKSGELHGLFRVRSLTQDDAHIFMTEEQVMGEIQNVMRLIADIYELFGFSYHVELSTRPEKSIGSDEDWQLATEALENAIKSSGLPYMINEGDGAFYGPKIDFHLKDSIGRTWQCGTIQLDFQLPLRFAAEYTGRDGLPHRPIMIHRTVFGSIERFLGILTEHYAGKFPVWLAPVQVKLLPVSDKHIAYARQVQEELEDSGIRVELDERSEKLGYKIREARLDRVPYMVILGEKEQENKNLTVRERDDMPDNKEQKQMSVQELVDKIRHDVKKSGI